MTPDEKLDLVLERQQSLHADLRVHIAKDEDQWRRVAEAEENLEELTKTAAKVSKKQAAILASLSGGVATIASVAAKAFL